MSPGGYTQHSLLIIIALGLDLGAGILVNTFIIFVIYHDFITTKKVSSSFKILLCLAISNVCYDVMMTVILLDYFCSLGIFTSIYTTYIFISLLLVTICLCTWFTGNLGIFYFLKISNFETGFLFWARKNIVSLVPWMLLVDFLMSMLNGFLSSLLFIFSSTLHHNSTNASSSMISTLSETRTSLINSLILDTTLPFSMVLITTLYTVVTLKKHGYRMKNVQTSESLRSYQRVVWRMTQSLFFYGIFYIVMMIFYFGVLTKMDAGLWLMLLVISSFPTVQAILLVLANPRLKDAWKETFLCVHLQECLTT